MGTVAGQKSAHAPLPAEEKLAATAQQGWGQGAQPPCVASGEKQDKAQASAHLTARPEDGRSVGHELAALGYTHRPFLQCSREDSLTHLPLCALS